MIPTWLRLLSNLTPILIILSIGFTVFGISRLKKRIDIEKEGMEEEEQKRQEFLRSMSQKLPEKKLEN